MLILLHSNCRNLKWSDAAVEGLVLRGLQLEELWDHSELKWILSMCIVTCIVITTISTAISKNWQTGLAAGGLFVALASFIVGAITLYEKLSCMHT